MRKRFESLWAIRPEAALTVVRLMARDMAASNAAQPDLGNGKAVMAGTQWAATAPSIAGSGSKRIAIIPIQGVLTNDGPAYHGSNYQTISTAAERAAADPDVSRIVLAVDSPGGEVTGLPEAAAVLARVAKSKPVSAIVEGTAASAAYWLASQASGITLTPSGEVGSVGVRMMHVDISQMLEKEGYKVTELSSGQFKTEWSPYHPLTDEAQGDMQTRLEASHKDFVSAITRGRAGRASAEMVKSRYGAGRMLSATEALKHGLVDKLQSSREFYRNAASTSPSMALPANTLRRARLDVERLKVSLLG